MVVHWETRHSARGFPYRVPGRLRMPRIADHILDSIVYLYPTRGDAEAGESIGGCGFLMRWQDDTDLKREQVYIVTNWHVVYEDVNLWVRLNTSDGAIDTFDTEEKDWFRHPEGDDLAICPIELDETRYLYKCVPNSMCLSKSIVDIFNIGPGDDAYSVGRFINHEGKQKNLPTTRFGCIAQMPWEKINQLRKNEPAFDQESFLLEMRSIGGYSGAPIYMEFPTWAPTRPGQKVSMPPDRSISHGPWLLGINWGYLVGEPLAVYRRGDKPSDPDEDTRYYAASNSGLMAAVPAWKLTEFLNDPRVARLREAAINMKKKSGPPRAISTSVHRPPDDSGQRNGSESDDANPNHLEDFRRLVDVAARKRPQGDQT
jgi:hypothetical protein